MRETFFFGRERDPKKMLKNVVFRVLEFPGKKICKKTRSMRVVSAFGMISLSLSLYKTLSSQTHHHHHHHHHRPIRRRRRLIGRKSSHGRRRRRRRRRREKERCVFLLVVVFFCLLLVLCCGLCCYYASNSFLVRRIEWPSAAPRRLRTPTTKTTKTRTEGRRRRVGK